MVIGISGNLLKRALLERYELFVTASISFTRVDVLGLLYFILLSFLGCGGHL